MKKEKGVSVLKTTKTSLLLTLIGLCSWNSAHTAMAVIVFQDDSFHEITSTSIFLDSDNTGAAATTSIIANQGTDNTGTIRYNALSKVWELSNDGGAFDVISTQSSIDLDIVYGNDSDKILDVDTIEGIRFDLTSTGDLSIADTGTAFATFGNDGSFTLTGNEDKEFIQLFDNNNTDSVGIFSGINSPEATISAESGSLFLAQSGRGYLNISDDNGSTWASINTAKKNSITVAKQGGDFTTIEAALASITDNSASNPYVIHVFPGTYLENPLTMKSFVDLVGVSGVQSVRIEAINPSANLITLVSEVEFSNFILDGVSTGACVSATGILRSFLTKVELEDCEYGVRANLSLLGVTDVRHRIGTMSHFIYVENGSFVRALETVISGGVLTNAFYATGIGTTLITTNSGSLASSSLTNGIYVDNGATLRGGGLLILGANNAIRVGSTGTDTTIQLGNIVVSSVTYDLLVEANNANIAIASGVVDRNKVDIPYGNDISILINDQTEENNGTINLGEFATGSPENPSEGNFGEGDNYTTGMLVYTFNPTGSVYTDVSEAAKSQVGSTFSFTGTTSDHAIYISSDRTDQNGDFVLFQGYKSFTSSTGLSPGAGSLVHEYWNGSSWVAFDIMCTHELLYYRYDSSCFLRPNSREQIRFDRDILDDWTANDPPSTGTNRYWVRIRISNTITTAPLFDQFKIHSSRTEIGPDGTINFFANARQRRTFITSPSQIFFGIGSSSPSNASYTVGTGAVTWSDNREEASFRGNGNTIEEITGSISLPKGIDTSNGLTARIYWKKSNSNAGNVQWKMDYLLRGARNVLSEDGANLEPAPRPTGESIIADSGSTIDTTPTGTGISDTEIILSEFTSEINIANYYEGDLLFVRLYRDPADVDDTYTSDSILIGFEMSGIFWTLGEKL